MAGKKYRSCNRFMVYLDDALYSDLVDRTGRRGMPGGSILYNKMNQQVQMLLRKGLQFEELEKRAPIVTEEPAKSIPVPAAKPIDGIPVCHERPMVDYGDFYACLIGGEKILK